MTRPEITRTIKVAELLENYPELEDALMEMAPEFRKLRNPVLRKTIARVTSLQQAALIAEISSTEMVNRLRVLAGQSPLDITAEETGNLMGPKPDWVDANQITLTYDAGVEINSGKMPLAHVLILLGGLDKGQILKLISPLMPAPLLEKVRDKGFYTWTEKLGNMVFHSYILKK